MISLVVGIILLVIIISYINYKKRKEEKTIQSVMAEARKFDRDMLEEENLYLIKLNSYGRLMRTATADKDKATLEELKVELTAMFGGKYNRYTMKIPKMLFDIEVAITLLKHAGKEETTTKRNTLRASKIKWAKERKPNEGSNVNRNRRESDTDNLLIGYVVGMDPYYPKENESHTNSSGSYPNQERDVSNSTDYSTGSSSSSDSSSSSSDSSFSDCGSSCDSGGSCD